MNKFKMKVTAVIGVILLIGIYYYVTLPAINIHASEFWMYLVVLVILAAVVFIRKKNLNRYDWKESKGLKVILGILAVLVIAYVAGSVLSSPIVNAKKYQELLTVKNGEFTKDIEELSFDQIPLLDKDSAELLGDRKMGSMVDMVSQFEVDELYSQINYQDQPVRVSPLKYASVIKWFTNMREGIPAYIKIDMATQNTELVKLSEGMKYTTSDHFNRNIYRHLRFNYPTYIFNDLSFEIDEDGVPYWICPVKKYNIGLFGGTTIGRVVLCNAITGETKDYAVEDVPQWVDRVYSADLLVELYNYHGTLKHGFFNSVLGQKDCLNTTDGYNYLAIDDDVWAVSNTHLVKIIEQNRQRCEELCELLPKATIINGDATDHDLLVEEGIDEADAFVSLTGMDEENIILSLFAKSQNVDKIVTKVNEDRRARMVEDFGIDSIVSVKTATADAIMSYVRARKNSQGSANVETMYQLVDDKVEALEFIVKAETNYTGIPLKNLSLKPNNLIACIARKRQIILPSGDDCIQVGDNVIIITMEKQIEDIKDILM